MLDEAQWEPEAPEEERDYPAEWAAWDARREERESATTIEEWLGFEPPSQLKTIHDVVCWATQVGWHESDGDYCESGLREYVAKAFRDEVREEREREEVAA